MSTFRTAVAALKGKEVFIMLGEKAIKVTVTKVNDDLVILTLAAPSGGVSELSMQIDQIVLATA
jgi:hypothetical protein